MDPSAPTEVGGETKEKKKIHFSVPAAVSSQLDPRQVEMIRRRRPTPATLFRVAEQPSPEDDGSTHQWIVGENGVLKPKRVNPSVYQPPSLKAVQRMAQAHMQKLGACPPLEDPCEGDESDDYLWLEEEGEVEESPVLGAGETGGDSCVPHRANIASAPCHTDTPGHGNVRSPPGERPSPSLLSALVDTHFEGHRSDGTCYDAECERTLRRTFYAFERCRVFAAGAAQNSEENLFC
uniref:Protein phosphatase 1 regulatory subunit 1B n=1 Tax=Scleropages formosus TaxID=113540 RepID=A0A8C9W6T8_SCLFO